jgi:hypothetical protein
MLVEYRITMPFTFEQYLKGFLFIMMKNDASDFELIKNEKFENENGKGLYTYKIITPKSNYIPSWAFYIFKEDWIKAHEECWNSLEYNGYVKTKLRVNFF